MDNTGARVQENLDLRPCDLQLDRPRQALLRGKGGKQRCCPLWKGTAARSCLSCCDPAGWTLWTASLCSATDPDIR